MKIFLSWSGDRSKAVAAALRDWLPLILHYAKPWLSQRDIGAGERWALEIGKELEDSNFGIVVLTSDNLIAPWILFESGALSKAFAASAVVPYLVDVDFKDVTGPLDQFQAKKSDHGGTLELVAAMNSRSADPLDQGRLEELFDALWPKLASKLAELPAPGKAEAKPRSQNQVLEDVVASVRRMEARFDQLEARVVQLVRPTPSVEVTVEGRFPALGDAPAISSLLSATSLRSWRTLLVLTQTSTVMNGICTIADASEISADLTGRRMLGAHGVLGSALFCAKDRSELVSSARNFHAVSTPDGNFVNSKGSLFKCAG